MIARALAVFGTCLGLAAGAATSAWPMQPMDPDLHDKPSLQRGLSLYVNYCLACHSLKFQRYERTADDLGIPHDIFLENLVFTGQKIGGLMTTSMPEDGAKAWFGARPPDLTMVARVRGEDWLYNYLKTFYLDPARPFGVNNKIFENVAMPHVMMGLQGVQQDVCRGYKPVDLIRGEEVIFADREPSCFLEVEAGSGTMSAEEFDGAVYDIVNFLYYVGEPTRLERQRLGVYVLLFLVLLFMFAYLLNREYWKDVH